MGVLEKIAEALATNEAKKDRLKKFILLLMLEWEDFEGHLALTGSLFRECLTELQSRKTHLSSVQESVSQSSKEMDLIRKSIEQRFKELEEREQEFHLFKDKSIKQLKLQQEMLSMVSEEVEVREEKLNEQENLIQGLFEKIELEQKQFEVIRNSVDERFNEIGLMENIRQRVEELDLKDQKVSKREKEFELREKILDLKRKEIELKERKFGSAKILKKQLQIPDSGAQHGFQLNEEGNLAPSEWRKQSADAPGNLAALSIERGGLKILEIGDTQPRHSKELINKGRKRGSSGTENEANVAEKVFAVNDYQCSMRSCMQMHLIAEKGRESASDDVASSSKRLRGSQSCNCFEDEQDAAISHNYKSAFSAEVETEKARMGYHGSAPTEESLQIHPGNFDAIDVSGLGSAAGHSETEISYYVIPWGEFSDVDKYREESCFSMGQI